MTDLLLATGRAVHGRSLLSLAEERSLPVGAPQVLAGVRQLETPAEGIAAVKLHPTLIVQTVLVLYLVRDQRVVPSLREVNSNSAHSSNIMMSASPADPTFLSYHDFCISLSADYINLFPWLYFS